MGTIHKCRNQEEVREFVSSKVKTMTAEEVIKKLPQFIKMDEAIRSVYLGLLTNTNVVLYGPGGYGKTDIVVAVCGLFDIPVYTKVGYEDMMPEELIGIPNMARLIEDSEYVVSFDKSVFANPGILILEEFLDCNPKTAITLKDIITSGGFKDGESFTPSLIGTIVITGNKDPEQLATSDSLKALYIERFPVRCLVKWDTHYDSDYLRLFMSKGLELDDTQKIVASVCSASSISPRGALDTIRIANQAGLSFLPLISSLNTGKLDYVIDKVVNTNNLEALNLFVDEIRYKMSTLKMGKAVDGGLGLLDRVNDYVTTPENGSTLRQLKLDIISLIK